MKKKILLVTLAITLLSVALACGAGAGDGKFQVDKISVVSGVSHMYRVIDNEIGVVCYLYKESPYCIPLSQTTMDDSR